MAVDHFEKHYVKGNPPHWNFNIIFDNQADVLRMAEDYAPLLSHPGLYGPMPPEWLHATILSVGPVDEYTEEEMQAVADKLEVSLAKLELPEFRFDSWWLWGGNVVLHISPEDKFTEIYDAVIEAMVQVVGEQRTRRSPYGDRFVPHTGLAYTRTHDKENEVHAQLAGKQIKPAAFKVSYLPLLRQKPVGGHYEWEIIRKIPIGAANQ